MRAKKASRPVRLRRRADSQRPGLTVLMITEGFLEGWEAEEAEETNSANPRTMKIWRSLDILYLDSYYMNVYIRAAKS